MFVSGILRYRLQQFTVISTVQQTQKVVDSRGGRM